jgi:hypothetical protein
MIFSDMNEAIIGCSEVMYCRNFSVLTVVTYLITGAVPSQSSDKSCVDRYYCMVSSVKTRFSSHMHSSTARLQ